jgi:Uma2 family endonuclease
MPATLHAPPPQKRKALVTGADLLAHPEWGPCELIRGKVVSVCRPNPQHGCLTNELAFKLTAHSKKKNLGKVVVGDAGIYLERDPDTVRGPDIFFVRSERVPKGGLSIKYLEFAPDLCVEIVSPNDAWTDIESKVKQFLAIGVRLVWVVDPKRRVARVYRADGMEDISEDGALSGEDVMPGFSLKLKDLFAALD